MNVIEPFFKTKTFKSLKEVMKSFFNGKNFKSSENVIESFFGIKTLRQRWCSLSVLKTVRIVRKWWSPFFSIKNFRSSKVVMKFFLSSFFSGHASLSFHMMYKFPGTTFDHIGTTFEQHFFDYNNILISRKKDVEHISVNTGRGTFPLHE